MNLGRTAASRGHPPGDHVSMELNLATRIHAEPMPLEGLPCVGQALGMELEVVLVGLRPSEGWEAPSPVIIFNSWAWAGVRHFCSPESLGHLLSPRCAGLCPAGSLVWVGIWLRS